MTNEIIKSAHCDCDRNLCKNWIWSNMCGKHCWTWSKAEHCIKMWYSGFQTYFGQSVHSQSLSSLVPRCPISHCNACELSLMRVMVQTTNNGIGSNLYLCLRFLVQWTIWFCSMCNICSIISCIHIFPISWYVGVAKERQIKNTRHKGTHKGKYEAWDNVYLDRH